MNSPRLALLAVALAGSAFAEPKVWLDERFADGERATQALPASAEWLSSSATSTVIVAPGSLVQTGGGRHVLAYFTPKDAPAAIGLNETLVLTYEIAVSVPADGPGALRVGLFNSGGHRVVMDKQARSADFAHYRGYMGAANPAPSKNLPLRLFKRTGGDDTLIAALPPFFALGEGGGALQPLRDGVTYTGTLTIQRSPSGQTSTLTHGFSGGDLSLHQVTAADSLEPVTTFDTVVFHAGTKAASAFTLKSVRIEIRKN